MKTLDSTIAKQSSYQARKISESLHNKIVKDFKKAKSKVLFLDYDGTLQRYFDKPQAAAPDNELYELLDQIVKMENVHLVLVSGRDRNTIESWFGNKNYNLIAEHGAWERKTGENWLDKKTLDSDWKEKILPILESFVDSTAGSLIEEKDYSLVWHYRKADIELGVLRALELRHTLSNLILNQEVEIIEGKKLIEIKASGINKGTAALEFLKGKSADFILAFGDGTTDEFLFKVLPENSYAVKVGSENSIADYYVANYKEVRNFLKDLLK